jgi:hypothetical protein
MWTFDFAPAPARPTAAEMAMTTLSVLMVGT